jgi:glycosyltransferase involved in cell wall biosynthesis
MKIGFDAKRAFHNHTGLGVFSRVLIQLLVENYPDNHYYLFNPKPGRLFNVSGTSLSEVLPPPYLPGMLSSLWRSKYATRDIRKLGLDLYHGLSHEIPRGMPATGIPSIVTMHDLFPEIYPDQYKPLDVKIYRIKSRYACRNATRIMAISQETKKHIVEKYRVDPERIEVIYQSFDPVFSKLQSGAEKERIREKYQLPPAYFLHVGSIIERKNLLNICRAMKMIRGEINIPLVVVGDGKRYKDKVKQFITENQMEDRILFLSEILSGAGRSPVVERADFPAIYQMATAMIYPSFYEGFGIPIVEAMAGGVPVITSNTSCLPEVGGKAAFYVDPDDPSAMAEGFRKIYGDPALADDMAQLGFDQVKKFLPETYAGAVMKMYETVVGA